jgi:serine/threonine-protein kinase
VDRRGEVIEQIGQPVTVEVLDLSPDDRHVVTYVASNNADISRFDAETGDEVRLTFDQTTEDNPVWSPDGRRIAYRKILTGREHHIEILDVAGHADPESVYSNADAFVPRSWSPDGVWLLLANFRDSILILNLDTDSVIPMPASDGGEFSPDGRWLAYTSRQTGQEEVYVVSFPGLQGRQQVSMRGGSRPEWSAQSGELFFRNGDTLMVSRVSTEDAFVREDVPQPLFVFSGGDYEVSADGQRFLVAADNPDAPAREIRVVLNWFEELKAKVGN